MGLDAWGFVVAALSGGVGLVTVALVIRSELRERRLSESIHWAFHTFATQTRTESGTVLETLEVAELVQFGRQPTRILHYYPVGFTFRMEDGYRLRSHIFAEDTLPLLIEKVDRDNAWLLISHFPRDDQRWLVFDWVPLEPASAKFHDRVIATINQRVAAEKTLKRRLLAYGNRLRRPRSIVRPVGPDGHRTARLRANTGSEQSFVDNLTTITSLAGSAYRTY